MAYSRGKYYIWTDGDDMHFSVSCSPDGPDFLSIPLDLLDRRLIGRRWRELCWGAGRFHFVCHWCRLPCPLTELRLRRIYDWRPQLVCRDCAIAKEWQREDD